VGGGDAYSSFFASGKTRGHRGEFRQRSVDKLTSTAWLIGVVIDVVAAMERGRNISSRGAEDQSVRRTAWGWLSSPTRVR